MRTGILTCLTFLVLAAPAGAVVGGTLQDAAAVPWYADVGSCGGTLVRPDRVMTAEHCVRDRALDRPVEGVAPVTLGGAPAELATILGKGMTSAGVVSDLRLRRAELRTVSDKECTAAYRTARGNDGERFKGSKMLCATDPDGRKPLASGCNGDSGGPLYTGPDSAPRILGVVSFGGLKCGADHLPSVFTEVDRYRSFVLQPSPTLAPVAGGPARIAGKARVGRELRCSAPRFTGHATRVTYRWAHRSSTGRFKVDGRQRAYTVRTRDRGHTLLCLVEGSNAGGPALAPPDQVAVPR